MHYFLMYDVVPDYVERRASFREEHLTSPGPRTTAERCCSAAHSTRSVRAS